jgi:hypothetical protein
MRLSLRAITLVLLLLAAATAASANSVSLTINNGGSITDGGVYVGPYNFTSNGQSLHLICDIFQNEVDPPETWTASTGTIGSAGTGLLGSLSSTQYLEVAWLVEQMFSAPNAQTIADIQWAVWDISDAGTCGTGVSNCDPYGTPSNPNGNAADPTGINGWVTAAGLNHGNASSYSNLVVYTPVNGWPPSDGVPQEYIGRVPEPGTLLLLGAGLFSLVAFGRRLS